MAEPDSSSDTVIYGPKQFQLTGDVTVDVETSLDISGGDVSIQGISQANDGLAVGEMVPFDRRLAFGSNLLATLVGNQALSFHFFTAHKTEEINSIETYTGGTAAGATPTLCRKGIYEIDSNGDGTLIASTPNDTALWAATNTNYLKELSSPFNKIRGRRYAVGLLIVTSAAVPILQGVIVSANTQSEYVLSLQPRIASRLGNQADLPASFLDSSLINSRHQYAVRLVP